MHNAQRETALVVLVLVLGGSVSFVRTQETERVTKYSVLMAGRIAGHQTIVRHDGGAYTVAYEYTDRGRGPSITERVESGAAELPVRIEITGLDYLKNRVSERFTVEGDRASWTSDTESGSGPPGGFYASFYGAPGELALLARALLAAGGRRLALLPAGEARIDRIGERTFSGSDGPRSATLYAIDGLGLSPSLVWLDADRRLFAVGSSWILTIREGFEGAATELLATQDEYQSGRLQRLATTLPQRPASGLVIRNASVLDVERGTLQPSMTILISGTRITAVGPDTTVKAPREAAVLDVGGKTVMPGLVDMHTHIGDEDGLLNIAAGVTTVRDLANDTDELEQRRKRFDEGTLIGPRVVPAGFMDGPGPYAGPTKVLVATAEEARAAVRKYADLGYIQIKVYSSIKPELVPAIVEESHARGMRVSGHIPEGMTAEQAVEAGFDEIQHANFLFLNFWAGSIGDTRTPARFVAVAERAATLDLGSPQVTRFVDLLKARNVVVDPTVNVFENMFLARKGMIDPSYASIAPRLPPQVRRGLLAGGLPVPEGKDAVYRESFENALRMVKRLHDAGVTIVPGTDAFAGFAYHRELELYEQAGIPAADIVRLATIGAARVARMDKDIGTIAPGKLADLIVVDGNPADRVGDVRRVRVIVKGGVVYENAALYKAVGIQPAP
jgi:imidazolonepropionase-like amidohydrolase